MAFSYVIANTRLDASVSRHFCSLVSSVDLFMHCGEKSACLSGDAFYDLMESKVDLEYCVV